MIIEALQKKENFTGSEVRLAEYLLENIDDLSNQSLRDIAQKALISPPTVTRLSQKLGCNSFSSFRVKLITEYIERKKQLTSIDYNFPFAEGTAEKDIAGNLAKIKTNMIQQANEFFDFKTINSFIDEFEKRKYMDIYASGMSCKVAGIFAEKMNRMGYVVNVIEDQALKLYRAKNSNKDDCVAICISYSGLTRTVQRCVELLSQNNVIKLLITGNRLGPSVSRSEYVYYMNTDEMLTLEDKMDSFGEISMLLYIMDVMYSMIFIRHYKRNIQKTKEVSALQVK